VVSDETLVTRSLQLGSHHFGELVKRYSDYLFGFGMRLSAGNTELSRDLSQQTFVRAFRYLSSFNKQYSSSHTETNHRFRNWLTGIAINCFNDLIDIENHYQPLESHHEPSHQPNHHQSEGFYQLIRPLSSEERAIFTLKYVYEYKIEEIGEIMNLKPGTVKSKISRALERLRENHHA